MCPLVFRGTKLKKALNKVHKYSITIGEQRQLLHKIEKLNDELTDKNKSLCSRNRELSADNNTLKKKYDTVMAVYRKVESIAPDTEILLAPGRYNVSEGLAALLAQKGIYYEVWASQTRGKDGDAA